MSKLSTRLLLFKRISSFLALVALSVITALAVINIQYIQDVASYHQYQPSDAIASFASDAGMNEYGKFLFYASQPSLEMAESFSHHCGKTDKSSAILGCYNGQKIYIYNIEDPRLVGIKPTTAAHEMLHAAYRRLSNSDRETVNRLLEDEYRKLSGDLELAERMDFYAKTQPGEDKNELHSIIGTEVRNISPELEEYYKRYFSDRTKVLAQREQYYAVFKELRDRADALSGQIDSLEQTIKKDQATYGTEAAALQADITTFNDRANRGEYESQSQFDRERRALLVRSAELERLRVKLNNEITEYNRLVSELNAIAIETEELNRSIDSNPTPAPSLQGENG